MAPKLEKLITDDGKKLTTAAGVPVVDNQNIITAGQRGPALAGQRAALPGPFLST